MQHWAFMYIHTLCMQAEKVQMSLLTCADSPEPSLLADVISTKITSNGPYIDAKVFFLDLRAV